MEEHSLIASSIRKATIADVPTVHRLINGLADSGAMLPRALSDLYENLRDYYVVEQGGQVIGCCALHICWEDLAEVRSLAVDSDSQGRGLGRALVQQCLREARELKVGRVFTLTLKPAFFEACGFSRTDVASLPRKIWGECFHCPKFPNCDEVALVHEIGAVGAGPADPVASLLRE
ncbi:MAG: N-acetyltransferase [Chloroflexota bacterium]